jgi:NAD(P)-dependent dehydrogenase (short-subunit alcohol dehydrogenase family)
MTILDDIFKLEGKKALVTGASKGFGADIAQLLAQAGADVAACGRDRAGLNRTKAAIEKLGRTCLCIEQDLATVQGALKTAEEALAHFGAIDILVNNAGVFSGISSILDLSVEEWDLMQAINLRAPFLIAKRLAPKMIEKGYGKIINITSDASMIGQMGHSGYSASKGGLRLLTQVMAAEWGPHNIMTNAVAPTVIMTEMGKKIWGSRPQEAAEKKAKIALGRFGEPKEVAHVVLFLASHASDFLCGATLPLDGGLTATR